MGGLSKGGEPSTSYRETDSKFTSVGSLRFAKARVYIPFPSKINALEDKRPHTNFIKLWRISNKKKIQKET